MRAFDAVSGDQMSFILEELFLVGVQLCLSKEKCILSCVTDGDVRELGFIMGVDENLH